MEREPRFPNDGSHFLGTSYVPGPVLSTLHAFLFFFFFFFKWLNPRHMKIPRLEAESELQLETVLQLQQCRIL